MRISCVSWKIAYKKKNQESEPFHYVKNPWYGWAADPFIYDYNGKTYLFAELWDYRTGKGSLGYKLLNEKSTWRIVIDEEYHLSYPHLITIDNQLYMCPESNGGNTVAFYECVHFPDKWKKMAPILDGKYCDTTFVKTDDALVGFTCNFHKEPNELLLFRLKNGNVEFSENNPIKTGKAMTRPGGEFYFQDDKMVRVSQDNTNFYGEALFFSEGELSWPTYSEKIIKRIDVSGFNGVQQSGAIGVHTYNSNEHYEVIDLRYNTINIISIVCRLFRKIKNTMQK